MIINREALRRAGGITAVALLVVTLGAVGPASPGVAVGPVTAITPREVIPNGFVGAVRTPSLSGRGQVAGVFDQQVQQTAFVFLDTNGQEPMVPGLGTTVSGDGCVALWARNNGSTDPQASVSIGVTDRCAGGERVLYNTNANYQAGGGLALSFNGRFGVFHEAPCFACEFDSDDVFRVDTQTGQLLQMPHHGAPYFGWDALLGVDISDDGSVVVATEDGNGSAAVATFYRDVVAWDVASNTTSFVSGPPIQVGAAGFPSISADGRFVSFTSAKPLTGAQRTRGPWVFVADRTNGSIRMVSAPADSSYHTSITQDATQVAYAVGPAGCQYDRQTFNNLAGTCAGTRIDVAYGPAPGFTAPFATETINIGLNNAPAGGLHIEPALSGNGRWVAWISDAGNALVDPADPAFKGLQQAFVRTRDRGLVIDPIDFGTIGANTSSTLPANVHNTGRTSVLLASITATPGQFTIQGGGSCVGGTFLPPSASCTVNVRYSAPNSNSTTTGTINISEGNVYDTFSAAGNLVGRSSFTPPPTTSTTTTTVPGRPTPTTTTTTTPTQIVLDADPNPVDYGQVAVGLASSIKTVTIRNVGTGSGQVLTDLGGDNPADFYVVQNGCNEAVLAPAQTCTMDIMMIPLAGGLRSASLILTAGGASGDVALFGDGHFAPQLLASPAAITTNGITTIIGRGFPPNGSFAVKIGDTGEIIAVTSDATGVFRIPYSAFGKLSLGNYVLEVDPVPDVFDLVRAQLVVVLPTFEPQGPGGPVFGDALIVTRGG